MVGAIRQADVRRQRQETVGHAQSIAIFGEPSTDKFEFVHDGPAHDAAADGNPADTSPLAARFSMATPPTALTKGRPTRATSFGRKQWLRTRSTR